MNFERSSEIINYFPTGFKPREAQRDALQKVEAVWDTSDVIVINLPVATGKSLIAMTIAKWAFKEQILRSRIITPQKVLVDQYLGDFPKLNTLRRKDSYVCNKSQDKLSCPAMTLKRNLGHYCSDCVYTKAIRRAHQVPYGVYNNHIYMAYKLHSPLLIADEAHNLVDHIRSLEAKVVWQHKDHYPDSIQTYSDFVDWLKKSGRESLLRKLGLEERPRYLVEQTERPYGRKREIQKCLLLKPIDVSEAKPYFWPKKVEKIILLSATIGKKDIEQMGLVQRRVTFIEAASPIAKENRPVNFRPVVPFSYQNRAKAVELIANAIQKELDRREGKGLIHVTYETAMSLRAYLHREPRLIWHTKEDKLKQYQFWRGAPPGNGQVFIASGLYEGIDLPYDAARWQVLTKVPYPSLKDSAMRFLLSEDPEAYYWATIKLILQASGRISRKLDDYGETLIWDSNFQQLYEKAGHLFPGWWRDSLNVDWSIR
jgi:Rad3-related DNA helicase